MPALKFIGASKARSFGADHLFPSWAAGMDYRSAPVIVDQRYGGSSKRSLQEISASILGSKSPRPGGWRIVVICIR